MSRLRDLNFRHLRLISLYSSRYAVRGGTGLVFLMITLTTGLLIAWIVIDQPIEQQRQLAARQGLERTDEELVDDIVDMVVEPAVTWVLSSGGVSGEGPREWTRYLLREQPALLSAVLLVLVFSFPFIVVTGAFNQFSGDVASRGLRYHLMRSARVNIFFGRFVGTCLFSIVVMTILILTVALYLGLKLGIYDWGPLIAWSLRGLLALAILCPPYVALCSWISSTIDSPIASLCIVLLVVGAVPLFALIGRAQWEPLAYINYALPWGLQNYLLHPDALTVLGTVAACLGYTAVFLYLGYRHFKRRDL